MGAFATVDFWGLLGISIVAAIGMNLVYITGQLNLGQAAFYAIGAYTAAWIDTELGWPLPALLLAAAVVAGIGAMPIAWGASRLAGIYLIMGTLAAGQLVQVAFGNAEELGGRQGYRIESQIALPEVAASVGVVLILATLLMTSRFGLRMRALFDDSDAAAVAGVAVRRVKIFSVVVSASVVGIAGGMWALWIGKIEPREFGVILSFDIALYSLIGGVHSLIGAVAGAVVVEVLTGNVIRDVVGPWAFVIYGALVMVLIAVLPEGLVSRSFALRLTAPLRKLRRRRVESGVPSHARVEPAGETVLTVRHVGHRYDGVVALDDVSLEVRGGEVLALIGANGAGKSTLIDVISGRVPNEAGAVTLLGTRIDGMPAHRRKAMGVGRTFQDVRTFAHLTVEESLRLSAADGARSNATVEAMLDRVALGRRRDDLPEALTVAERRRLDIARAAIAMPSVLLLDEPSVGMVEQERIEIAELIGSLRDEGMAVVVVDHNLDLALGLADRVGVLDFGVLIALGSPDAVLADERVRAAYLGHADPLDGVGS